MKNKVLKRPLIVLTVCLHQHMCVYWHHKGSREAGERSSSFTKTMTLKLNYTSILVQRFARRFTHQMENRATSGFLAGVNFESWHQCKYTLFSSHVDQSKWIRRQLEVVCSVWLSLCCIGGWCLSQSCCFMSLLRADAMCRTATRRCSAFL